MTHLQVIENKLDDLYKRLGTMVEQGAAADALYLIRLQIDLLESVLSEVAAYENEEQENKLLELQKLVFEIEGVLLQRKHIQEMSCDKVDCEIKFFQRLLEK